MYATLPTENTWQRQPSKRATTRYSMVTLGSKQLGLLEVLHKQLLAQESDMAQLGEVQPLRQVHPEEGD